MEALNDHLVVLGLAMATLQTAVSTKQVQLMGGVTASCPWSEKVQAVRPLPQLFIFSKHVFFFKKVGVQQTLFQCLHILSHLPSIYLSQRLAGGG